MDLTISCSEAKIGTSRYSGNVDVTLEDVSKDEILAAIDDNSDIFRWVAEDYPEKILFEMDEDVLKKYIMDNFDWISEVDE